MEEEEERGEEREEERRGGRQIEAPASLLTTIATTHCHTSAERTALLLFSCHQNSAMGGGQYADHSQGAIEMDTSISFWCNVCSAVY